MVNFPSLLMLAKTKQ